MNSSVPIIPYIFGRAAYGRSRTIGRTAIKRDLLRIPTALFAASLATAIVARFVEPYHCNLMTVWAEAAEVGRLADWYAVVALSPRLRFCTADSP